MPPLLISGLILIFEKFVEPMAMNMLPTVASKLGSMSKNSTVNDVLSVLEGSVGKIADEKTIELKGKISELLAQAAIDQVEAASSSLFIAGARPFLFWGLSSCLVFHLVVWNLVETLNSLCGLHLTQVGQLDPMTMGLLSSLIGIGVVARTAEKISGVSRNSMDE